MPRYFVSIVQQLNASIYFDICLFVLIFLLKKSKTKETKCTTNVNTHQIPKVSCQEPPRTKIKEINPQIKMPKMERFRDNTANTFTAVLFISKNAKSVVRIPPPHAINSIMSTASSVYAPISLVNVESFIRMI